LIQVLKVVENYVGCEAYICVVIKYGANAIILLLMIMFKVLNLNVQACAIKAIGFVVGSDDFLKGYNNIFGVGASMEESSSVFVVGELSLFKRLFVIGLLHVLIP
jgi:hypothetical protein